MIVILLFVIFIVFVCRLIDLTKKGGEEKEGLKPHFNCPRFSRLQTKIQYYHVKQMFFIIA